MLVGEDRAWTEWFGGIVGKLAAWLAILMPFQAYHLAGWTVTLLVSYIPLIAGTSKQKLASCLLSRLYINSLSFILFC